MKKIVAMIMAIAIILVNGMIPVYAETVDYTGYLTELKTLMDQCAAQGIPTDYELISYSTIERFQDYINSDLAKGISTTVTDYEKACIETIYAETKANLEAYLAGSKRAFAIKRPDMNNLSVKGKYVYDGENPVFSIGYGYFDLAKEDIPNFQKFGVNNIQLEIGPTEVRGTQTDRWYKNGIAQSTTAKSQIVTNKAASGTSSLYIQNSNNAYSGAISVDQNVTIPAGKYTLSFWVAGSYNGGTATIILEGDQWQTHKFGNTEKYDYGTDFTHTTGQDGWTKFEKTLTVTGTNTKIRIVSDGGESGFYIDDISLVKEGTTENLLKNSGFEESNTYYPAIDEMKKHLKIADENNVAVSLLLSPHYFPDGISGVEYNGQKGFLKYNIDDEPAKAIIEEHIRTVLSELKDYDAIDNICLSNEPLFDTRWYPDHFTPKFVDFLYEKYGSFANIKSAHGKSYASDSDIEMAMNGLGSTAIAYLPTNQLTCDWIEFNNKIFADWHAWMADIVEEYMPNTPVHAKVMEDITDGEGYTRDELCRGIDIDLFGEFSDYSGCDSGNFAGDDYYQTLFFYDYQQSSVEKPVYNSETHIIQDYNGSTVPDAFTTAVSKEALNKMWQEAIHGRSLSTVWLWGREYPDAQVNSSFYGSILFRPDLVDGIGKMNLDLTRLADELVELQTNSHKVAIFYSLTSRLYQKSYTTSLISTYKELLKNGYDVGIVTEKNVETLSEYDVLVVPSLANYTTSEARNAVINFANNGGKVLTGDSRSLRYNEAGGDMGAVSGTTYSVSALPEKKVVLRDVGLNANPTDVEWQYSITDDRILISLTNLYSAGSVKAIDVYYNGTKLENMTELISGTTGVNRITLNGYEPQLLEYRLKTESATGEAEIKNLTFDASVNKLYWEGAGEGYVGANIYKYNTNGAVELLGYTTYETYSYPTVGTYIVRPVSDDNTEGEGKVITTVAKENSVIISKVSAKEGSYDIKIDNITGNYLRSKVVVQMLDAAGNVLKYGYSNSFIAPNKSNELKLLIKQPAECKRTVIYVYDDVNNCMASQEIAAN